MATLTIRNIDESVKRRLRVRAAQGGRSMEAEARSIIATALAEPAAKTVNLAEAIRARFADLGGVELADTSEFRATKRRPPVNFD